MLSVVLLSVSATFAADDNVDAVAVDEIDGGEPLAVDEDSQALSEGDVVTNDTFYNYPAYNLPAYNCHLPAGSHRVCVWSDTPFHPPHFPKRNQ